LQYLYLPISWIFFCHYIKQTRNFR
jgi:hypothetical protein